MKISNKEALIILVSAALLISFFGYLVKGATTSRVSGYMVLMDHVTPMIDGEDFGYTTQQYSTSIFLPSDNCNCKATICSYEFPPGVNPAVDVNKDGRIDFVDLYLFIKAYRSPTEDLYKYFNITKCLFKVGNLRYEDPDRDCQMTMDDINNITKQYKIEGPTNPYSADCDERCRADLNKDGQIDGMDLALALMKYRVGGYADEYLNFNYLRPIDFDFDKDGHIDGMDLYHFIRNGNVSNFGAMATEQRCHTVSVQNAGGNEYIVSGTGYGIYHAAVSYLCTY